MASSVASEAILFIGAVIAATAFAGVFTVVVAGLADDMRVNSEVRADQEHADARIINDPATMTQSPDLVLYLKNTGSISLDAQETVVIIDGDIHEALAFDVLESADDETWPPGEILEVTATGASLGSGDHRVRAVLGTGTSIDFTWSG